MGSQMSSQLFAISFGLHSTFETMAAAARRGEEIYQLLNGSIGPVMCGFDVGGRLNCLERAIEMNAHRSEAAADR